MPVTKTARRALRVSERKRKVNVITSSLFEVAFRKAKKSKKAKDISSAYSLIDRASKKGVIHKNKAARLKSQLTSK